MASSRLPTRLLSSHSLLNDWLVVGAGPLGILTSGLLLDEVKAHGGGKIAWVDPSFSVGRMGKRYRNVPGNISAALTNKTLEGVPSLRYVETQDKRAANGFQTIREWDPKQTFPLNLAVEAFTDMTGVLQEDPDVELVRGRAISLSQSACCRHWDIEVAGEQRLQRVSAKRVALVVGGEPKPIPWKIGAGVEDGQELGGKRKVGERTAIKRRRRVVSLDDAVDPVSCRKLFEENEGLSQSCWGIVGNSHSGVLAAKNVSENIAQAHAEGMQLPCSTSDSSARPSVKIFGRRPTRYAEQREGYIKFDATGLKGEVAEWARRIGLGGYSDGAPASDAERSGVVQTPEIIYHHDAKASSEMHVNWEQRFDLHGVDVCVFATGFNVVPPPAVFLHDGNEIDASRYRPENGRIAENLYGFGMGYPELWTDPEGFSEFRVGFTPNFIQHVRAAVYDTKRAKYGRSCEEEGKEGGERQRQTISTCKTTVSCV